MNPRYTGISATILMTGFALFAEAPAGYYSRLDGKRGDELQAIVKEISIPADFVSIEFGDGGASSFKTWQCFITSDIRKTEEKPMWWDMYSNNIVYTYGPDNSLNTKSLNIEHAVPNSWWGGKNGNLQAYQDIFNLNPSNSEANNRKSANPMAVTVANPSYDNGLVKIGKPASGYGGNASTVFEPADEYKGDFARAYFYMFAAYPDIPWRVDKGGENMYKVVDGRVELLPWTKEMLLKWNAEDPVDSKEMKRNDEIFKCQKNRNPFIDMPGLAEYIWGGKSGDKFDSASYLVSLTERPDSPRPAGMWMKGVNTYSARYWDSTSALFDTDGADLWISMDGGNYQRYGNGIRIPAAQKHGEKHTIRAYCEMVSGNHILKSPEVTVTMIAKEKNVNDYSTADYVPVIYGESIDPASRYLFVETVNRHVMGLYTPNYMTDCWFARMDGERFVELPQEAAIVRFESAEGGSYRLNIEDIRGESNGYWSTTGNNKMKLDSQGTPATVSIQSDNSVSVVFAKYGSLQYNYQSPRFLNYSSAQGKVCLYRFAGYNDGSSSVENLPEDTDSGDVFVQEGRIYAPEGSRLYDIRGMEREFENPERGVYIVVLRDGKVKKVVI